MCGIGTLLIVPRGSVHFNTPYQKWVERGLFRIETNVGFGPDGTEYVCHTTRVTGKGQAYLLSQFIAPIV